MHKFAKILIGAAMALPFGQAALAQSTGVIDYDVTMEMDRRFGPGGSNGFGQPGGGEPGAPPQVVNFTQHFTFTSGMGKVDVDRPNFRGRGGNFQPPFTNTTFVDMTHKKTLQVVTENDGDKKTYYTEEDFVTPASVDTSSEKTKKIAGYNCKKAVIKLRDENFTVWYTRDLPGLNYSPVNGLVPGTGVVLSAESDKRSFVASKVALKPVEDATVALPAGATKISQDEMRDKRRDAMQKIREQRQQQQQ